MRAAANPVRRDPFEWFMRERGEAEPRVRNHQDDHSGYFHEEAALALSFRIRYKRAMKKITLITFQGCPNADRLRTLLNEAGVTYEDIEQDLLDSSHPLRGYTSPTLLAEGEVVFGSRLGAGTSGCTVGLPDREELLALIHQG